MPIMRIGLPYLSVRHKVEQTATSDCQLRDRIKQTETLLRNIVFSSSTLYHHTHSPKLNSIFLGPIKLSTHSISQSTSIMKGTFFSVLALPALFISAIAAPVAAPETAIVEKRQSADAYAIVDSLYTNVQQYTGAINETAASLHANSTATQNATAATAFITNVEAITTAVDAATAQVDLLSLSPLARRQTEAALAALVENLLLEVGGALNGIIGTLGLTALLGSLNPLVGSLSALLLSLENVVDNLLTLVRELVDGLLTGLSVGLAGLVL
ncbi:hypothetical protein LTR53_009362 [Teratosphaeriaceae sp. CCFEE 6253]|nr:hypothetical protein LTR53_009362 [Teratosphaeriaceae sp. CCFEE 6253]